MIFPGVVGTFCLILFLFATQIIPVNWAGVLLILLAVALFAAEAKVHSYGMFTAGGLAAMMLGAFMLVDSPFEEMRVPLRTLVPAALLMGLGTFALVRLVIQAQRRPPLTGDAALLGQRGIADTDLVPEGWIRVVGERWRALAEAPPVPSGEKVTVTGVDGLTLKVRKGT
jgi:membrane-bound serine protease (ClpP class)